MNKNSVMSKVIAIVLILTIAISSLTSYVSAADDIQRASSYLNSYAVYMYDCGGGQCQVWFNVSGTNVMDELGATTIILKESTDNGRTWSTVKTFRYTSYPNMLSSHQILYLSCVNYSGTVGNKYFAYVTVWAGKNGGGDSRQIATAQIQLA